MVSTFHLTCPLPEEAVSSLKIESCVSIRSINPASLVRSLVRKVKRIKMQTEDKHGRSSGRTCWHRACCSVNKTVDAPGGGHLTLREPRVGDGERRDAPWAPAHRLDWASAWKSQFVSSLSCGYSSQTTQDSGRNISPFLKQKAFLQLVLGITLWLPKNGERRQTWADENWNWDQKTKNL